MNPDPLPDAELDEIIAGARKVAEATVPQDIANPLRAEFVSALVTQLTGSVIRDRLHYSP